MTLNPTYKCQTVQTIKKKGSDKLENDKFQYDKSFIKIKKTANFIYIKTVIVIDTD